MPKLNRSLRWITPACMAWVLFALPAARAQEIRDSLEVSGKLRPEFGIAIGAAFPQGDFTRNVNTGLDGYARFSYPIVSKNGLSIMAVGGASDFSSEDQGAIVDSTGNYTSATQSLDYRSASAHLGLQWTGSWQSFALRPRVGVSAGANWVETQSTVRVSGALVDSLTQTTNQTRPGLRLQLGSDWVLRNNVALTFEFKLDHVFKVAQYQVSDGVDPAGVIEKSVSYISFVAGLVFPL
jgi:hypothetical protein